MCPPGRLALWKTPLEASGGTGLIGGVSEGLEGVLEAFGGILDAI